MEKKNLNIRAKTLKLTRENIGVNLHDLVYGDGFLERTPNTQMSKGKKIIWILYKLKTFMLQRTLSIK